jgi:hypothetical protein
MAQRSNQLRSQGIAAGDQAAKSLTEGFAGRGFSTLSPGLAQQQMLARMMGQAQGQAEASKDLITMGGEDAAFSAIRRQMEQDRLRNQMLRQQASTESQIGLATGLLGLLRA